MSQVLKEVKKNTVSFGSLLSEAKKKASRETPPDNTKRKQYLKTRVASLERQRKSLLLSGRGLLGIERDARSIIKRDARRLALQIKELQHEHRSLARRGIRSSRPVTILEERAKREPDARAISLVVFQWRNKKTGFPDLALFSLDSPEFTLETTRIGRHFRSSSCLPDLPKEILVKYQDQFDRMYKKLGGASGQMGTAKMTTKFTGVIPAEAKTYIAEAVRTYGRQNVYILAEARQWTTTRTVTKRAFQRDPIVVAWDGKFLRYICDFDLTPVEEMALFASEPPKRKKRK